MIADRQAVIIVAGGSGKRMGGAVPKQFAPLCGREIIVWTVEAFADALHYADIVVVLPRAELDTWHAIAAREQVLQRCRVCCGGESRAESVFNGLSMLDDRVGLVGVHDGVRPLITPDTIRCLYAAAQEFGSAVPVTEPVDSLRMFGTSGRLEPVDRSLVRAVQTPQIFSFRFLKTAYGKALKEGLEGFTDDASLAERFGAELHFVEGEAVNIKITRPADLIFAEAVLSQRMRHP